jgi:hypothetical protein
MGIPGEGSAAVTEDVAVEVIFSDFANCLNPLFAAAFDSVETFLKLPPALLFGELRDGFSKRSWPTR